MKFIANIWPIAVAEGYKDIILEELAKEGPILSIHEIQLTYVGLRNYMIQIYRHEKWAGNYFNHFRGIYGKLNPCFHPDSPMYLVEIDGKDVSSMLACKERIRKLCKQEKHSLHTSDTEQEYLLMKKILLHAPTVSFMNEYSFDKYIRFTKKFFHFLNLLDRYELEYANFLVVSNSIYLPIAFWKKYSFNWTCKKPISLPKQLESHNKIEFRTLQNHFSDDILNPDHYISYCGIDLLNPKHIKTEQTHK